MIILYLRNIIDDYEDGWKIQLAMVISFASIVKDSNKDFNKDSNKDYNYNSHKSYTIIYIVEIHQFLLVIKHNTIKELFKYLL